MRAARAAAYTGRSFVPRAPKRAKANVWTPQQDDALRALLGKGDRFWIAEQLTARFQCPRTATAVHVRIKKLGLSLLTVRPLSRVEVGRALGVGDALAERWVRDGLLVGIPWHFGGGQRRGNVSQAFGREHVESFLRAHVDQVAVERIRDRGFRVLAEALTRGARAVGRGRETGGGVPEDRAVLDRLRAGARGVPGARTLLAHPGLGGADAARTRGAEGLSNITG